MGLFSDFVDAMTSIPSNLVDAVTPSTSSDTVTVKDVNGNDVEIPRK